MLIRQIITKLNFLNKYMPLYQQMQQQKYCQKKKNRGAIDSNPTLGDIGSKYEIFRDEDAEIILDVCEERQKYASLLEAQKLEAQDPFQGLNLEHGKSGVFDIEDLVEVLNCENANDIFVATVPPECKYVDYLCVVSGKSQKHMLAIAQFIRKVYKLKRHSTDIVPKLEGADSEDWMALDLGNIAVHIFSKSARTVYDLDSLWSIGPEFDEECNKQDPVVEMLERHAVYLKDLQPAD